MRLRPTEVECLAHGSGNAKKNCLSLLFSDPGSPRMKSLNSVVHCDPLVAWQGTIIGFTGFLGEESFYLTGPIETLYSFKLKGPSL